MPGWLLDGASARHPAGTIWHPDLRNVASAPAHNGYSARPGNGHSARTGNRS